MTISSTTHTIAVTSSAAIVQVKRQLGSTDVASTLYQLAVVHTMAKPPNLDAAEAKLKHVLVVSRSSATRAATLQQLGRVCLRRGALKDAERYLRDTLELYTHTYKSDLHINVASIHFQLGIPIVPPPRITQSLGGGTAGGWGLQRGRGRCAEALFASFGPAVARLWQRWQRSGGWKAVWDRWLRSLSGQGWGCPQGAKGGPEGPAPRAGGQPPAASIW